MLENNVLLEEIYIPKGFILFISGVPGVGKTTISYELLKKFNMFRIIEETDILRDALRGYNEMLIEQYGQSIKDMLVDTEISDHRKLLSLSEAKQQCLIMKKSIESIVARQQRKGISSIINGVHIIPEILKELANSSHILFVNLYVSNEDVLRERITNRDPNSYMLQHIPFIYRSNRDLFYNTQKLVQCSNHSFYNIDVSNLSPDETILRIIECIQHKIEN